MLHETQVITLWQMEVGNDAINNQDNFITKQKLTDDGDNDGHG